MCHVSRVTCDMSTKKKLFFLFFLYLKKNCSSKKIYIVVELVRGGSDYDNYLNLCSSTKAFYFNKYLHLNQQLNVDLRYQSISLNCIVSKLYMLKHVLLWINNIKIIFLFVYT